MTRTDLPGAPIALKDPGLWRTQAFLAGAWADADDGGTCLLYTSDAADECCGV